MKEFIDYILKFGSLNQQQIDFITKKGKEVELHKDEYFAEAGKILRHVGFVVNGVLRISYYNNNGEEITKYFLDEDHLILKLKEVPISEYVQAATNCKLLVFSNKDWIEISNTIVGWEVIFPFGWRPRQPTKAASRILVGKDANNVGKRGWYLFDFLSH